MALESVVYAYESVSASVYAVPKLPAFERPSTEVPALECTLDRELVAFG
jgi:hypothetical protein